MAAGWTNVLVLDDALHPVPFICAYDHDVAERVAADQAMLDDTGGGPLGITGLRAVVVHVGDVDAAAAAWARLLGNDARIGHALALPAGPELRFEPGSEPPALVFGVRSLDDATSEAGALGVGCDTVGTGARLDPGCCLGLDLRLEVG